MLQGETKQTIPNSIVQHLPIASTYHKDTTPYSSVLHPLSQHLRHSLDGLHFSPFQCTSNKSSSSLEWKNMDTLCMWLLIVDQKQEIVLQFSFKSHTCVDGLFFEINQTQVRHFAKSSAQLSSSCKLQNLRESSATTPLARCPIHSSVLSSVWLCSTWSYCCFLAACMSAFNCRNRTSASLFHF